APIRLFYPNRQRRTDRGRPSGPLQCQAEVPMKVIHVDGLPEASAATGGLEPYLAPTGFLDFESPAVRQFVRDAIGDAQDERERAVRLFYAVRDGIRYDPYRISYED